MLRRRRCAGFDRVVKSRPEDVFDEDGPRGPSQAELLGSARPGRHRAAKQKEPPKKEPPPKPKAAAVSAPPASLDEPLPLVNPRVGPLLKQVGVRTYRDALWNFPRRFVEVVPITEMVGGIS